MSGWRAAAVAAVAAAVLVASCGGEDSGACTVPEGAFPDWIRVVRCDRDFELLWDERTDSVFSRTRTINWLIDREDGDRIYFINTRRWELHYLFAMSYLERDDLSPVGSHADFNILNYRRADRRFVLGKLIHYLDQELVTLEFSAGDTADADMIADAYERIAASIFNGDDLVYRPVSADQEGLLPELRERIPTVSTEDVFQGQEYQPLNLGYGFGTLRFARVAELAAASPAPTDIVVLDRVPADISLVSGIITDEFQTPLSHVNILSKNRGTPNMAAAGAFDDPDLRALDGKLVRLEVTAQDYRVREASLAEAQDYWDSLRPGEPLVPQYNESVIDLVDLELLGIADAISIGAKAANLAEMTGLGIPLPDRPFAIPFVYYQQHLESSGADVMIASLLADAPSLDPTSLRQRLFEIRWHVFRSPMDAALLSRLTDKLRGRWGDQRVRFRSSTNVEDLAEFSGAGLYTSAGASTGEGDTAIADAVKVVWAAAWNYQAFVERDFYRVDHERVRMGVLVHPAFTDEKANGVAVTTNSFAENRPAFYINSQVGEVSVTNPTGQATPEQILYYTWYEEPEYEVITRSSLVAHQAGWPGGTAVLTDAELSALADHLEAIHGHFRPLYPGTRDFAMDVEFKLDRQRQLVIKQARPLATPQ